MRAILFAMPDMISGFDLVARLPNLGIVSIAGNVDESLCQVKVCDLAVVKGNSEAYIKHLITYYKPHLIGLSCMTFQHTSALALAKLAKSVDKDLLVVLGGYHPTIACDEIALDKEVKAFIDFLVRGEGEATFRELIEAIQGKRDMGEVEGLSYKHDGEFKHNKPRKPLESDLIKLPNRNARIAKDGFHIFGKPADVIETSRGCTVDCSFCCVTQMYSQSFRKFSVERILKDIELARKAGTKSLLFADDNITLDVARFETICEGIVEHNYHDMHYFIQASIAGIASRRELSRKMARAGFKCVFLGIESTSEKNVQILNVEKKLRSPENIRKAVHLLKENDMIIMGGFILGNPDDREEDFWKTYETARELRLDIPIFYLITPYPRTRLRHQLTSQGLIMNLSEWSKYDCFNPIIRTKSLSADHVRLLHWKISEKWFDNLSWLHYNKIKKHYPTYFIKIVMQTWPRHLWKRFLSTFRIRSENDSYIQDIANKKTEYSALDGLRLG